MSTSVVDKIIGTFAELEMKLALNAFVIVSLLIERGGAVTLKPEHFEQAMKYSIKYDEDEDGNVVLKAVKDEEVSN